MGKRKTLAQLRHDIETEFDQPLLDVVKGFYSDGESLYSTAAILEVTPGSLRVYTEQHRLCPSPVTRNRLLHSTEGRANISRGTRRAMPKVQCGNYALCWAEWESRTGIPRNTLRYRVSVAGWPIEKAISTPVMTQHQMARHRAMKRWRG